MKTKKQKLTSEETEFLNAFEKGELYSVPNVKTRIREIEKSARAFGNKTRRVSLRMTEWDFARIQELALQEGLPYQSLLSSIIHKRLAE